MKAVILNRQSIYLIKRSNIGPGLPNLRPGATLNNNLFSKHKLNCFRCGSISLLE